jgi:hypothetical protein
MRWFLSVSDIPAEKYEQLANFRNGNCGNIKSEEKRFEIWGSYFDHHDDLWRYIV